MLCAGSDSPVPWSVSALGLAKALLWPLSGPKLLRETKNRSWQRRPKATGLMLTRRDALGEINVKVLFSFWQSKTQLGSIIAARQQSLRNGPRPALKYPC